MEESIIIEAFKASLQLDNEPNQNVQALISSIQASIEGLIPKLMNIASSNNPIEIRQLAATYIKNLTKVWEDSKREIPIPQYDKEFLRENIIKFLKYSDDKQIRSQFQEIVYRIAREDFPWEGVQKQIYDALESDRDQIYAALAMTYQIAKAYEYVMVDRNNFEMFIDGAFEKLDKLLGLFLNEVNLDNYWYISLILKIFWRSFRIEYPKSFSSIPQQLDLWLGKLKSILEINLGHLETPAENEEEAKSRDLHPAWVCIKWASHILYRLFISIPRNKIKIAKKHFQKHWAKPLLSSVLSLLYKKPICYIPEKVAKYLLACVSRAIKLENSKKSLEIPPAPNGKPAIPALISDIIIPTLYRTRLEEQVWQENPVEFLKKEKDFKTEFMSVKIEAIDLLTSICNQNNFQLFLNYACVELQSNPQNLHKEAILYALGSISQILKEKNDLSEHVKNFISVYILPEFDNPIGFLRARACWVCGQFSSFLSTDRENQLIVFQKICQKMLDPDLPVRYEAAIAFSTTLKWEFLNEKLSDHIKIVIEIYLKLMDQIETSELIDALQLIVEKFQDEITPLADILIQYLVQFFLKLKENIETNDEDESAIIMADILKIIDKLVSYLGDKPENLLEISNLMMPVFDYCFSDNACDFLCDAAIMLGRLLYLAPMNFLPHLFPYSGVLKKILAGEEGCALDYGVEFLYPLINFIAKYPQLSLSNLDIFISICFELLKPADRGNEKLIVGCKIFTAILENFKGSLDQYIPTIISQVMDLYQNHSNKSIKAKVSEVICISLWNNFSLTIQTLQNLNFLKNAWNYCLKNIEQYQGSLSKKYAILGLSSLISDNSSSSYIKSIPTLYQNIMKLWLNADEDTVMNDKIEDEDIEMDVDYDNFEDDDEQCAFEDLYDSPIQNIDLKNYLKNIFGAFSIRYPAIHAKACSGLNGEEIIALNEIMSN